jgi:4-carboxymuconolactone decarboxylase
MARVSLIDETAHPELAKSISALRSGRRGELINVYRLLLHSPDVAMGWFELLNAVRFKTQIDGCTRELVIVRVAILNDVRYVIDQHVPKLALDEGLSLEQCRALRDWQASSVFSAQQRAVLAYVDAMTVDVRVDDAIHAAIANYYDERTIVELTVLIGAYNMHTRVLRALEIDPEAHHSSNSSSNV